MRKIDDESYLDETTGLLYIYKAVPKDQFAPPNDPDPPRVLTSTGYTYDLVPTYGFPLGVIWDNSPIQFASQATAERMVSAVTAALDGAEGVRIWLDEVKVGPYTRAAIRHVEVYDAGGVLCRWNAGETASQFARHPASWRAELRRKVAEAKSNRPRSEE